MNHSSFQICKLLCCISKFWVNTYKSEKINCLHFYVMLLTTSLLFLFLFNFTTKYEIHVWNVNEFLKFYYLWFINKMWLLQWQWKGYFTFSICDILIKTKVNHSPDSSVSSAMNIQNYKQTILYNIYMWQFWKPLWN